MLFMEIVDGGKRLENRKGKSSRFFLCNRGCGRMLHEFFENFWRELFFGEIHG
jgi:hypothetical protein